MCPHPDFNAPSLDSHKARLGAYPLLPGTLIRLLTQVDDSQERDPSCDMEVCRLIWLLAFDHVSKASLLAAGAGDALDHVFAASSPEVGPYAAGKSHEETNPIHCHDAALRPFRFSS